MIWIKNERGRLLVDKAAVRARVEGGFTRVLLVTAILIAEPVVLFFGLRGDGMAGRGSAILGHSLAAFFLIFLLWTGIPVLRWIGAAALLVMGGLAVWEFVGARPGSGSLVQLIHGVLSVAAAGILGLSGSVKLYLAHREVRL